MFWHNTIRGDDGKSILKMIPYNYVIAVFINTTLGQNL